MAKALEALLSKVASILDEMEIDDMVLGGFALPSYGAIRSTVDLDIAVRIVTEKKFGYFGRALEKAGFGRGVGSFSNPVFVLSEMRTGLEVEFWLRPDGIIWDTETLRRRRRARIGSAEVWLVSPEDYLVTKLSRPDRGVKDEKDVKSVLERLHGSLDSKYLEKRASRAGVLALLRALEAA